MKARRRPSEAAAPAGDPGAAGAGGLGESLRPAWTQVSLDALESNCRRLRAALAPARVLAVVKADAYGHGAPAVGLAFEAAGVDRLGVALVEEGAQLRRAGVRAPILVLGTAQPPQLPLFRRYRLTPTVASLAQLGLWREWSAPERQPVEVHLKVDTGMTRLGVAPEEAAAALEEIRRHPGLRLAGVLSHLADADCPESESTAAQESVFRGVLELLQPGERRRIVVHLANSAGALARPASRHSLVRLGLGLYGLDPLRGAAGNGAGLEPAMSVAARIVQLRQVPAGARLGYGGRRVTARPSRLAVVPVGYADGYLWRLSDRAAALAGGRRVPVAGAVSMDMTLLDVTDSAAALGDDVVLLGRQGDEEITAWELADAAGTIPWELLCLLGRRLPRRYLRGGRVVEEESRFRAGPV
jgi:alanine racemase